jgi:hypothetical protein
MISRMTASVLKRALGFYLILTGLGLILAVALAEDAG